MAKVKVSHQMKHQPAKHKLMNATQKEIITVYRYGKSEHFIKELCYFTLSVPLLPSIFKKEKCNNVRYNSSYTHNFSIIVTLIQ